MVIFYTLPFKYWLFLVTELISADVAPHQGAVVMVTWSLLYLQTDLEVRVSC